MERTGQGLRNALFDEIEALKAGISNPQRAKAVAVLANTILKEVETEMQVKRFNGDDKGLLLEGHGMSLGGSAQKALPAHASVEEVVDQDNPNHSDDDIFSSENDSWEGLSNKTRPGTLSDIPSATEFEENL